MENTPPINYQPKQGVHVPRDVKEYVLKRIREDGKSLSEVAREHGLTKSTVHNWLHAESGGESSEVTKLKKENSLLKQLVAELSLKVRESEKRGW